MKINEIRNADIVYTPIYIAKGTAFVIGMPEAYCPTQEQAEKNFFSIGMDVIARMGVEFTGQVLALSAKGGTSGLMVDFLDYRLVLVGGTLFDMAKEKSINAVSDKVASWLEGSW